MIGVLLDLQPGSVLAMGWGGSFTIAAGFCLAIGLLLIYPALILRKYVRIMINILDEHAEVEDNGNARNGLSLVHETVSFRAADGHPLVGDIISARLGVGGECGVTFNGQGKNGRSNAQSKRADLNRSYRGMIVFAHEFGSERTSCLRYCKPLLRAGYDVFTFDFRGHGESPAEVGYKPRQWVSDREQADMQGAISFVTSLLQRRDLPRDVALYGVSRGAGAAILGAVGCKDVRAIVTDGAFSSDSALEYLMRRFATVFARIRVVAKNHPPVFWRFLRWLLFRECRRRFGCRFPSVRKAIRKLGAKPVLFIHGEKDSYIPVTQSQLLFDRAIGPKTLWMVPGAKHNQAVSTTPDEYARRIIAFLDEFLATGEKAVTNRARSRISESPAVRTPIPEPLTAPTGDSPRPSVAPVRVS